MNMGRTRLVTIMAGLVGLLALAGPVRADLDAGDITKDDSEPNIGPGAVLTYTIEVGVDSTPSCSTDITVIDSLPVDGNGNLQVEYLSSSCTTECDGVQPCQQGASFPDGVLVEPCLNGEGQLNDDGEVVFEFPGQICADGSGDDTLLIMTIVVRTNSNLEDPDTLMNCAVADDAQGSGAVSDCVTTLIDGPDLVLDKDSDPAPNSAVEPGDTITYTLTVSNTGILPLHGVVVQDIIPPNVTLVPGSAEPDGFPSDCTVCGAVSGGIIEWQFDQLNPGVSRTMTFEVTVNAGTEPGDVVFNIATAFDANGRLETDTTLHTINTPCLTVDKEAVACEHDTACGSMGTDCAAADQPGPGDVVTYEITVSNAANAGCSTAEAIQITESIPAGMSFEDCSPGPCFVSGSSVLLAGGNVDPGDSVTVTVELEVDEGCANGTQITDVATATAQNGAHDSDSETITCRPPILNVNKIGSPNPIEPGGTLNYSIVLSNSGANCSEGVSLLDIMPRNALFDLGSIMRTGPCSTPTPLFIDSNPIASQGTKFLTGPFDLDPGENCTVSFRMRVPENTTLGTKVVNQVTVQDSDGNSGSDTETTPVNSRLIGLSKVVSGCTFPPGGPTCDRSNPPAGAELTYTITASTGPYASVNTRVIDTLPDNGQNGVATLPSLNALTDCPNWDLNGNVLTCFLGDIPANSEVTFRVTILLNADNEEGTLITNVVQAVNEALDDLHETNVVVDAVTVTVGSSADDGGGDASGGASLDVSVSGPESVKLNGRASYGVTVTNNGDETAAGVTLSSTAPPGTRVGRTSPRGACSRSADRSSVTCDLGDLAPGQSATVSAKLSVKRKLGANAGDQLKATFNAGCSNCGGASGTATTSVTARSR
jgi:uncharacterized repeat protein (TIGR01451 family)